MGPCDSTVVFCSALHEKKKHMNRSSDVFHHANIKLLGWFSSGNWYRPPAPCYHQNLSIALWRIEWVCSQGRDTWVIQFLLLCVIIDLRHVVFQIVILSYYYSLCMQAVRRGMGTPSTVDCMQCILCPEKRSIREHPHPTLNPRTWCSFPTNAHPILHNCHAILICSLPVWSLITFMI